jgi:hypothetical protein
MKKYIALVNTLVFCTVATTIGMENNKIDISDVITFLDQQQTPLAKLEYSCHSTVDNHSVIPSSEKVDINTNTIRLLPNLSGTPKDNPLLWILKEANSSQQDLIKRAYEATIADKKLLIALPENPGITTINESQEIKDGRLYPTLALAVRNYLRTRLNITVY